MDLTPYILWAPTLLMAAARVAGIFLIAPVFAHPAVPVKLRVLAGIVIALAAVGAMGRFAEPAALPATWADLAAALASELAVGAMIGFAARLVFVGIEYGALHVGQQMGLGLAELFSPGQETGGPVRRLFVLTAVVIFLAIGGHRDLAAGVLGSFKTVPLASFAAGEGLPAAVAGLLHASFVVALKVAAPVLVAMLLATVAMGLLQKTLPQCNILSTGLPLRAMLGLAALAVALAALPWLVATAWNETARLLPGALQAAR